MMVVWVRLNDGTGLWHVETAVDRHSSRAACKVALPINAVARMFHHPGDALPDRVCSVCRQQIHR